MKRLLAALPLVLAVASIAAGDPSFYQRKSTWQETMFASREALAKAEAERLTTLTQPVSTAPTHPPRG